jgi:hypothetical protein
LHPFSGERAQVVTPRALWEDTDPSHHRTVLSGD